MLKAMLVTAALALILQSDLEAIERRVESALAEALKDSKYVGMTAAFVLPNGQVGTVALGMNDKESNVAMRKSDRMLAGSVGKTFFAALALQLVGEGRLSLDEKASTYLGTKEWFKKMPNHETITIRQLMNHTAGIPEHVAEKDVVEQLFKNPQRTWKPTELPQFMIDRKPLFEAGKGWSYADANYVVLGLAMERVLHGAQEERVPRMLRPEGDHCYAEISARFLKPLKLTATIPSRHNRLPELAQGYSGPNSPFLPAGPVLKDRNLPFNPSFEWAGGGFLSNSADLARWAWHLFGGEVLKPAQRAEMLKGVKSRTGPQDLYGLGAMIEPTSVGISYGHEGWYPGYLSQMMYLPDHKIAVAVQFNTDDQRGIGHRTRWFCDLIAKTVVAK